VLLLGDWHGTVELPAFFAEAVCRAAAAGRPVVAALELPGAEQAQVDRFLATGDDVAAARLLLASAFWTRDHQDGRSSRAMASALGRLRQLRRAGLPVEVFLFDVEPAALGADRDERMATRLAGLVLARPTAVVLALVGNFHARTTIGAPWDPLARPMGWHLRQAGLWVKSLDCAGPAGTAWSCPSAAAAGCGTRPVDLGGPPGGTARLELFPAESRAGFAGRYLVPSLTGSPPAAGAGAGAPATP
jgi:hypothetical protein